MEEKGKEMYKKVLEHVLEDYGEILSNDECLKLFTEGYKAGYKDGYKAAKEDMKTCMLPPQMMPPMKGSDGDGAHGGLVFMFGKN